MANTFELIASATAGAGTAASFDFTSIPATYVDLKVVLSVRAGSGGGGTSAAWDNMRVSFNGGASDANLTYKALSSADVGTPISIAGTVGLIGWTTYSGATANTFASGEIYIPNYTGSFNKVYMSDAFTENNAAAGVGALVAGLWSSTAVINRITVIPNPGTSNWQQYSSAYLYGLKTS
jgi:hypothetical protein